MGMKKKALKAIGYAKAPKATLFLTHPIKATSAYLAYRAAKKAAPRKFGRAIGVMAAAVAVPLVARTLTTSEGQASS